MGTRTRSAAESSTGRKPAPSEPRHLRQAPDEPLEERIARGRAGATPFFVIGSVAAAIWAVLTVLGVGALLLWWLL